MKWKLNLKVNVRIFTLIVLSLCFVDCKKTDKQIFYNDQYLNNTKKIIQKIFVSHKKEYDKIQILYYLPEYFPRNDIDKFHPTPPPNNSILFPEIQKELLKVNYNSTAIDIKFFTLQELNSEPIAINKIKINYKKPYLFFKQPIFNKKHDLAWIQYGMYCGSLCAFESIVILKKKNNRWEVIYNELLYVS
jgi:hypothetical protein